MEVSLLCTLNCVLYSMLIIAICIIKSKAALQSHYSQCATNSPSHALTFLASFLPPLLGEITFQLLEEDGLSALLRRYALDRLALEILEGLLLDKSNLGMGFPGVRLLRLLLLLELLLLGGDNVACAERLLIRQGGAPRLCLVVGEIPSEMFKLLS